MRATTTDIAVTGEGRVIRYRKDQVGNDLTAMLMWCETHYEPVWVFGDDSFTCPHTRVTLVDSGDHRIVVGPWERTGRLWCQ